MQVDVAIVGNGPTARLAHLMLSGLGLDCVTVGPIAERDDDPRTIALMPGTVSALDDLGIDVRDCATPLPELVIQTTGPLGLVCERFRASELGQAYLALNVAMPDLMGLLPPGDTVSVDAAGLTFDGTRTTVTTADGGTVSARLVVAADGAGSRIRDAAGIRMTRKPLHRSAFCAPVRLERGHGGVCIERYDDLGSITVIPVGERNGSLITIGPKDRIDRLRRARPEVVGRVLTERQSAYGSISLAGAASAFPLSIGWVREPAKRRVVAIGEAAHTVPPIGAQGWNMAVRDVSALREALASAVTDGKDIGDGATLAAYARQRKGDLAPRLSAVGLLSIVATRSELPFGLARQVGAMLLSRSPDAKHRLMRSGLG